MPENTIEDATQFVANFLNDSSKSAVNNEGAFCTAFVLCAEYVDVNGQYYTWVLKDDQSPVWRLEGLLNYVLQNEIFETEDDEEDSDY